MMTINLLNATSTDNFLTMKNGYEAMAEINIELANEGNMFEYNIKD